MYVVRLLPVAVLSRCSAAVVAAFLVGVSTHDCMHVCDNVGTFTCFVVCYGIYFRQYILLALVLIVMHKCL